MPQVVFKLFAGQGTWRTDGRTDGQSSDYMLTPLGSIKKNWESNHKMISIVPQCLLPPLK